jgi:cardiolipin synthase (CMP-forming)
MRLSWLPNAITLARMLMAPPLAWLILEGRHGAALLLAAVAGLSDAVDGLLAKRCGWQSRLGGLLDPIADKLMLLGAFVALGIAEELPWWLVGLVVARDAVIVSGALAYHRLVGPLQASPSGLSKVTTAAQIALVLLVLVDGLERIALPGWLDAGAVMLVAALTLASGLHYVAKWGAKARRAWRRGGSR